MQKIAVHFKKQGAAIYHSHRDLIRFWERAIRRAGLPVRLTEGFNPHPRMVFLHALGVGISSQHEEIEIELNRKQDNLDLLAKLRKSCADTLEIIAITNLPPVKKGRVMRDCTYLFAGFPENQLQKIVENAELLLAAKEIMAERKTEKESKTVEIRQYIKAITVNHKEKNINLVILNSQQGTARADELLKLLVKDSGADWRAIEIIKTSMSLTFS